MSVGRLLPVGCFSFGSKTFRWRIDQLDPWCRKNSITTLDWREVKVELRQYKKKTDAFHVHLVITLFGSD